MSAVRLPPMPFYSPVVPGRCRWCGAAIVHPPGHKRAGEPARNTWCPKWTGRDCVGEYMLATSSDMQRRALRDRDKGICAGCGEHYARRRKVLRRSCTRGCLDGNPRVCSARWCGIPGSAAPMALPEGPCCCFEYDYGWQADHIVPLWSVDRSEPWPQVLRWWSLDNLQTLCLPCHDAKCAAEAAARASLRRPELHRPSDQMALFGGAA